MTTDIFKRISQITKSYRAAHVLYSHDYENESLLMIRNAMRNLVAVINDLNIVDTTKVNKSRYKLQNLIRKDQEWLLEQTERINPLVERYENISQKELREIDPKYVLNNVSVIVARLKKYARMAVVQKKHSRYVFWLVAYASVILIITGFACLKFLRENRPVYISKLLDKAAVSEITQSNEDLMAVNVNNEWLYGPEYWQKVFGTKMTCGGQEREVIWAHPINDSVLKIELNDMNISSDIFGCAGFSDYAVNEAKYSNNYAPVEFAIAVNNQVIYRNLFQRVAGWNDFFVPYDTIKPFVQDKNKLTVKISCENINTAHFGFDLWASKY